MGTSQRSSFLLSLAIILLIATMSNCQQPDAEISNLERIRLSQLGELGEGKSDINASFPNTPLSTITINGTSFTLADPEIFTLGPRSEFCACNCTLVKPELDTGLNERNQGTKWFTQHCVFNGRDREIQVETQLNEFFQVYEEADLFCGLVYKQKTGSERVEKENVILRTDKIQKDVYSHYENSTNFVLPDHSRTEIYDSDANEGLTKERVLQATALDQKGSEYPELKGLATTAIVTTCLTGAVFYLAYMTKGMDTAPFWMLLHFIQIVYLMIILEVNQPANLVYFLDRLDHSKLDLNYISEFTGIRNAVKDEIDFRPDRAAFYKIDWFYGSVLVNLAFYARIMCTVILLHIALKILLHFGGPREKRNDFFKFIHAFKQHISEVFYVRYLIEISLFFWTAIFIEFVSTEREGNLQQLSLMFAINTLLFLLYFTFSFVFAFFAKNTRETYRGFYYTYFLLKRAIIPITLISFAYASQEWQLSMLIGVQVCATVFETIFKLEKCIINRIYSIVNSCVLILYLCLNFMFLDENPDADDPQGQGLAVFIAVYIIASGIVISGYRLVTFIQKLISEKDEGPRKDNPEISHEVASDDQEHGDIHPSNPKQGRNGAATRSPKADQEESPEFNSGSKESKQKEKTTPYNSSSQNRNPSEAESSRKSSENIQSESEESA